MPFDNFGQYVLPVPAFPAIPGETILAESRNEIDSDIANALNEVMPRDGSAPVTGDLNMANYGIKNVGYVSGGEFGLTLQGNVYGTTLPLGTGDTRLATTEFVKNTAMAAAIPVAPEDAGKFLTNNGSTSSWSSAVVPDYLLQAQGIY